MTTKRTTIMKAAAAAALVLCATLIGGAQGGNNVTQAIVYTATSGGGLVKGGTAAAPSFGLIRTCGTNETLKWNGSAWACASDVDSGGDITGVTAGDGLINGGTAGNVTLDVACLTGLTCAPDSISITARDFGDVTTTSAGSVWTIDPGVVTLAKMADVATARFLGRTTAGTGAPEALTGTQATALLDAVTTSAKGLVPTAPNDTTKFFRGDGTWASPDSTTSLGFGWFGTGGDGALHYDGSATVAGIAPSGPGNTWYQLTGDVQASSIIIDAGITIFPAGWRIFNTGAMTGSGTISADGNAASGRTAGGSYGGGGTTICMGSLGGGAGGNGNGALPSVGSASNPTLSDGCANGAAAATINAVGADGGRCQGGAGGSTSSAAAVSGGSTTTQAASVGATFKDIVNAMRGRAMSNVQLQVGSGGGGGRGAETGFTAKGGGGGGGGGIVIVATRTIADTITLTAKGGAGGNAEAGTGNAGGGGGGGGGAVVLITVSGNPTMTATGGAGGTGVVGTGKAGGSGGNGYTYLHRVGI